MKYRLEFHTDVAKEYEEAYEWYEIKGQGLGEKFLTAVRQVTEQILEQPFIYGERSKKGFREARVKGFPYLIVYKVYINKKIIFVNTIHHTSRNPRRKYRK
jgi:mRNA-degrading endonuclease RelE of RelBE toxin-antitoxin system